MSTGSRGKERKGKGKKGAHLEDVFLAQQFFSTPACEKAEFGSDETDLPSTAPHYCRCARKTDELVQFDESALESSFHKSLIFQINRRQSVSARERKGIDKEEDRPRLLR